MWNCCPFRNIFITIVFPRFLSQFPLLFTFLPSSDFLLPSIHILVSSFWLFLNSFPSLTYQFSQDNPEGSSQICILTFLSPISVPEFFIFWLFHEAWLSSNKLKFSWIRVSDPNINTGSISVSSVVDFLSNEGLISIQIGWFLSEFQSWTHEERKVVKTNVYLLFWWRREGRKLSLENCDTWGMKRMFIFLFEIFFLLHLFVFFIAISLSFSLLLSILHLVLSLSFTVLHPIFVCWWPQGQHLMWVFFREKKEKDSSWIALHLSSPILDSPLHFLFGQDFSSTRK